MSELKFITIFILIPSILVLFFCFPFSIFGATSTSATSTTSTEPVEPPKENGNGERGGGSWTYEQLFNELNDGDLNGQDNWSGAVEFDVQTTIKYEGEKALEFVRQVGVKYIDRSITPISAGLFYYKIRTNSVANVLTQLALRGSGKDMVHVALNGDKIKYLHGIWKDYSEGGFTTTSDDTWYKISVEFDDTAHPNQWRFNVYDSAWRGWTDWGATDEPYTTLDTIRLYGTPGGGAYIGYWDAISPDDVEDIEPELLTLIENETTGAEFFIKASISYGRIIIILLLLVLFIFEITKFLIEFIIPEKIYFRK